MSRVFVIFSIVVLAGLSITSQQATAETWSNGDSISFKLKLNKERSQFVGELVSLYDRSGRLVFRLAKPVNIQNGKPAIHGH